MAERTGIVIPAVLDPARDDHGMAIARVFSGKPQLAVAPANLSYIALIFTNRSGSTYLGDLLATTGIFNYALEVLNGDEVAAISTARGFASFPQYFYTIAAEQAKNGYFVFKASIGQMAVLAAYGILGQVLHQTSCVVIERMDKLAQAVSWQIAVQTGLYSSLQAGSTPTQPVYDRAMILGDIERFALLQAWTSVFMGLNGVVPLHLTYEMVTSQPRLAIRLLSEFVGQPGLVCDPAKARLQKQATRTNTRWCNQFIAGQ